MRIQSRPMLVALVAALALAAAVGTASAARLEISNQAIRTVWREVRATALGLEITCPVTVEGSFHSRTISKIRNALVGYITRAIGNHPCRGSGEIYILNATEILEVTATTNSLPWHIRYDSFTGTLPNIRSVRLQFVGASSLVEIRGFGLKCLYLSTVESPLLATAGLGEEGTITEVNFERATIPVKAGQSPLCAASATIEGTGQLTLLGNENAVTIRLVR
jgi:hypothetical protein